MRDTDYAAMRTFDWARLAKVEKTQQILREEISRALHFATRSKYHRQEAMLLHLFNAACLTDDEKTNIWSRLDEYGEVPE